MLSTSNNPRSTEPGSTPPGVKFERHTLLESWAAYVEANFKSFGFAIASPTDVTQVGQDLITHLHKQVNGMLGEYREQNLTDAISSIATYKQTARTKKFVERVVEGLKNWLTKVLAAGPQVLEAKLPSQSVKRGINPDRGEDTSSGPPAKDTKKAAQPKKRDQLTHSDDGPIRYVEQPTHQSVTPSPTDSGLNLDRDARLFCESRDKILTYLLEVAGLSLNDVGKLNRSNLAIFKDDKKPLKPPVKVFIDLQGLKIRTKDGPIDGIIIEDPQIVGLFDQIENGLLKLKITTLNNPRDELPLFLQPDGLPLQLFCFTNPRQLSSGFNTAQKKFLIAQSKLLEAAIRAGAHLTKLCRLRYSELDTTLIGGSALKEVFKTTRQAAFPGGAAPKTCFVNPQGDPLVPSRQQRPSYQPSPRSPQKA